MTADVRPPGPGSRTPSASQRRYLAFVATMLDNLAVGRLRLVLPDGRWRDFGDPDAALHAELRVHRWRFFRRLVTGASVGVGEAYIDGDVTSDDLVSLFRIVIANRRALRALTPAALATIAGDVVIHRMRANRLGQSRRNVVAHYDLSNDLYRCFLDDTMTYSSAWFDDPGDTLSQAQTAKYRRLAAKARIDADCHVLEIGCGWGGFA
jgi:cyclopropane-fatty-acyl-phospholipid synthase